MKTLPPAIPTLQLRPLRPLAHSRPSTTRQLARCCPDTRDIIAACLLAIYAAAIVLSAVAVHRHFQNQTQHTIKP